MGMTLDTSEFDKGLMEAAKEMRGATQKGLGQAGMQCLNDCLNVSPTVPLDEGTLRGSGTVHVGQKLIKGDAKFSPPLNSLDPSGLVATISFNTPYAAYQHEGIRQDGTHKVRRWSEPGSGPKYLEAKLSMFRSQYLRIVAMAIEKAAASHTSKFK